MIHPIQCTVRKHRRIAMDRDMHRTKSLRHWHVIPLAAMVACVLAGTTVHAQNAASTGNASRDAQERQQAQKAAGADEAFTVKPESIAFGKRPLNTAHTESFWVRAKSREPVRIAKVEVQGGNEKAFTVTNHCQAALRLDEDCRIDVVFEPASAGDKVAELRLVTGDGSVRTRRVSGAGVQAQYKVSTQSLQFGQVGREKGSEERKVTITNTGPIALPVTSTSLSGPNEKQFAQSNDCPEALAPGRSCTSTVVFRPTFQGHHEATLTVWAKGGAPETKVALRGTGS
jgi:hypothetical protein